MQGRRRMVFKVLAGLLAGEGASRSFLFFADCCNNPPSFAKKSFYGSVHSPSPLNGRVSQ